MPFIKKSFITERLLPNVAIEKLIGSYVTLKKSGSNYTCCCPFHHEKTPSFSVTPSKQMFYCFGCKEHGNAIDFIMKYKNLGFVDAVEEVAQFAGIEIEYDKSSSRSKDEVDKYNEYYALMDACASYFTKCLMTTDEGRSGLEYFRGRGLSDKTIRDARLGFAPQDSHLLQKTICKSHADVQKLIDLGLLVNGSYGTHAMFRNRVMIPIFDRRGRIISFGGRTMGDDKPKYMNTKETPIYRKRNELFGLYEALRANNNRPDKFIVVEGYMDVISLRQAGCTCAVASLGTATTPEQIGQMFRYSSKIVFCYDGDSAGRKAAWHAFEMVTPIMQEEKDLSFVFLPVEHDPDSLVREKGLDAFNDFISRSMSYPDFMISHFTKEHNLNDPNDLINFTNEAITHIAKIPLPAVRNVTLQRLSKPAGMTNEQLYDMLKTKMETEAFTLKTESSSKITRSAEDEKGLLTTPMRRLMAFIIQQPTVVSSVYTDFSLKTFVALCKRLDIKGADQLEGILEIIRQTPSLTPANFIEIARDTRYEKIVRMLMDAPLNLMAADGTELSFENRIDYLSALILDVIFKPLRERADFLKLKINREPSAALLEEHTAIQRIIH